MHDPTKLRVLVVDDTIFYRKIINDVLSELPDVEIVGTAHNGKAALIKIQALKPDLITLDIEMPEMNGLQVLENLQSRSIDIGAIMLSTLTQQGSTMTIRALELGAFDFIPKPQSGTMTENMAAVRASLGPMIKAFARSQQIRRALGKTGPSTIRLKPRPAAAPQPVERCKHQGPSAIIAIGVSTGGPSALARLLPQIPADIGVPIAIVQHMPPMFTKSLAASLNAKSAIEVCEARDGEALRPNVAYIAPGGRHMKIVAGAGNNRAVHITDDPPENSCRPSVDYLFRSVADHFVGRATAVIMTGMGSDGTAGLRLLKNNGAVIIAQNEASCVVFGMPREPIESGLADVVAPLDRLAQEITRTVFGGSISTRVSRAPAQIGSMT